MGLQIKEILAVGERILSEKGVEDYKQDAETLLCHEIHYDAKKLFMNWSRVIDDSHCEAFFESIQRRASGIPTQYITQKQGFMGLNFFVNEEVLIPRADTETLAESVQEYGKEHQNLLRILDLCTGSGNLAVYFAKAMPSSKITATDIDRDALAVARTNAETYGVSRQIRFLQSDLFAEFKTGFGGQKYDVIVSNPPYIRSDVLPTLQREIYEHEPLHALDGGFDGLDFYRRIIGRAHEFLRKQGALFLEIGYDQGDAVKAMLQETEKYQDIKIRKDLGEADRVISARLKE
ncbi:MAG: peptide chain release factor N(5)-glutamine methyltransferase [Clostridiales Family XIII bacterium]|jgi:release factor glutamine methyltransferase|nr:peptide chain release factor N(5)-glutamine methyltransferase [Clostridiales Family XIII bacterium]